MADIKQELAEWIDDDVIADTILDALEDEEINPTLENAKKVWLDVLYTELGNAVERSVEALADKGDFDKPSEEEPEDARKSSLSN